ncbi:MAG: thiamine-phosphate kinase [Candidatus Dadabacteria bacterium]|nr:thiamine-phosphate kinase [Candidatus Dadabacteria bacterium]
MIDELSALKLLEERFSPVSRCVELGIGDDAAALRSGSKKLQLATTDSQVEGTHFTLSRIGPRELARKAIAVALSDIGAMGGVPKFFLASAGLPGWVEEAFFKELIEGFSESCHEFGVELIGGNICASDTLFIDITALGEVEPEHLVRRSGASAGQDIYVSGTLGDAALGLKAEGMVARGEAAAQLLSRYTHPTPRLSLGRELALRGLAAAMIDVSDGLLLDLLRIVGPSGLGAEVRLNDLPLSGALRELSDKLHEDLFELALSGGEDYELLFTARAGLTGELAALGQSLGVQITKIGSTTASPGLRVLERGGEEAKYEKKGFVHFGEKR